MISVVRPPESRLIDNRKERVNATEILLTKLVEVGAGWHMEAPFELKEIDLLRRKLVKICRGEKSISREGHHRRKMRL